MQIRNRETASEQHLRFRDSYGTFVAIIARNIPSHVYSLAIAATGRPTSSAAAAVTGLMAHSRVRVPRCCFAAGDNNRAIFRAMDGLDSPIQSMSPDSSDAVSAAGQRSTSRLV